MIKRTVSAAIIIILLAAALALNSISSYITIAFFAALAAVAVFEMIYTTRAVKNLTAAIASSAFSASFTVILLIASGYFFYLVALYIIVAAILCIFKKGQAELCEITMLLSFPIIIPVGFTCIYTIFNSYGIAYILLLLNFSSVCDVFAYLVGTSFGKHKLCPLISPKKTVEGAVGGIAGSLVATVIVAIMFKFSVSNLVISLILTPFMCLLGMGGDLFASLIKRSANIKDYGKIIPGHGGIMDRCDSILLIAPAFLSLIEAIR